MSTTPEQLHAAVHAGDKACCTIMRGMNKLLDQLPALDNEITTTEMKEVFEKVVGWHSKLSEIHKRFESEPH